MKYSGIIYNDVVSGPGFFLTFFTSGCPHHCPGCHNKSTWALDKGTLIEVSKLAQFLREKAINKKVTISGGEPLLQKEALLELLEELKDFDLCLYTGHEIEEVPEEILKYLKYIKVGRFILEERTSTTPFVGSKNQKFVRVHHEEAK